MMADFVGLLLLLLPGAMLFWLNYLVLSQFDRAGIKLTPFQAALLLTPVAELLIWLWRFMSARGMGLLQFDASLALFVVVAIGLMAPTKWCEVLVMSVRDILDEKLTGRAIVVIVILVVAALFLLQEILAILSVIADIAKAKWGEVPKSKQFFSYGLGFALLAGLSAVGIGTVYWNKPHLGNVTMKGVATVLCTLWGLCWIVAILYALFEGMK